MFGDILESLSLACKLQIGQMSRRLKRAVTCANQQGRLPARAAIRRIGELFCKELHGVVRQADLAPWREQFCYRCSKQCRVSFSEGTSPGDRRVLAIAGVTCVDFSAFGRRSGLAGKSMVALAAWLAQVLADEPDLVIIENVVQFRMKAVAPLKQMFDFHIIDFSPEDLGIPSPRRRKYMLLTHKRKASCVMDIDLTFGPTFFRDLVASSHVYCVAEQAAIQREIAERSRALGVEFSTLEETLRPDTRRRLIAWLAWAESCGHRSGFVNLSQNVEYLCGSGGRRRLGAPTLLRSSHLYCLGCSRVLTAPEYLLIMGIRNFPLSVLNDTVGHRAISSKQLREFAGNGMHAAAVGSFIIFTLGSTIWL